MGVGATVAVGTGAAVGVGDSSAVDVDVGAGVLVAEGVEVGAAVGVSVGSPPVQAAISSAAMPVMRSRRFQKIMRSETSLARRKPPCWAAQRGQERY